MFDLWFPHIARAAADLSPLKKFIVKVEVVILNPLIKLGFAVALIVFLYGVFEFIKNGESSEDRKKGGQHMLYGIIGMFLMFAAGGIINLICGTWGLTAAADNCKSPFSP